MCARLLGNGVLCKGRKLSVFRVMCVFGGTSSGEEHQLSHSLLGRQEEKGPGFAPLSLHWRTHAEHAAVERARLISKCSVFGV